MPDRSREKVTVAYPYGNIDPDFHASMLRLAMCDALGAQRMVGKGDNPLKHAVVGLQSTHLVMGRNKIVNAFLDELESDWLLFIDTDQVFEPDIIERLVESADPVERPIVSALIVAQRGPMQLSLACVISDGKNLRIPPEVPAERWWKCIPGTGCTIIHRTVLEQMRAKHAPNTAFPFFAYPDIEQPDGTWDTFGEDYTFMLRAIDLGHIPVVDTTIEVGHVKSNVLWPEMLPGRHKNTPPVNVVVIPFKDKWQMTSDLVDQLVEQGEADRILLYNNGSSLDTVKAASKYAGKHESVQIIDAKGLGIHEMWNCGAEVALEYVKANVCFLNNDLRIGDNFISGLSDALRGGPTELVAVCPNYDKRDPEGLEQLHGICGDVYDGTGGLSGFAFMVKAEWFHSGYRFPEDAMWWYGDNDLTLSIDGSGGLYAMARWVEVEHLDGGGQTGDGWVDYGSTPQGKADLEAFLRRWPNITLKAAS